MTITIGVVNRLHNLTLGIFEIEDSDYVDRRKIAPKEREIEKILDTITKNRAIRQEIKFIMYRHLFKWGNKDTITDLKKIGVEVV